MAAESELVRRAIGGNEEALTELLHLHGPTVRASLAGAIPAHRRAVLSIEDVMQETYTDAFLDIRGFTPRGEGDFAAWLTKLAKRNLLDALKAFDAQKRGGDRRAVETRGRDDSYDALYEFLDGSSGSPSRHAARNEARAALVGALARLPDHYRRVVEMYDLDGRPMSEVAAAIGRSEGAAYLMRLRAHRKLRVLLGGESQFFSETA